MLQITLRDDGGLTLVSDDRNAENQIVSDCFSGGVDDEDWDTEIESGGVPPVEYDVLSAWDKAPFESGKLEVAFDSVHTEEILEALTSYFPEADEILDQIYAAKRAANPPRPKPERR